MKRKLTNLWAALREQWLHKPVFRALVCLSAPALLLCLLLGGWSCAMLGFGYVQLVFASFLPGELVEVSPLQRVAAFCGGLSRMLFFTGITAHAALPLCLMGGPLLFCLLVLRRGEREGMEMSPLPLLSAAGFAALGLVFGVQSPAVGPILAAALALTLTWLLVRQEKTMQQLAMRFHVA